MKRRSLFSTAIISILFLPISLSDAQETNTLPNTAKYIGEMKDGKPNGQGKAILGRSVTYEGEWRAGKLNGQGTADWSDGTKFVGEFKNGKYDGQGTMTWSNGQKFVGEFFKGEARQGTFTYANGCNGCKYVGELRIRPQKRLPIANVVFIAINAFWAG